MSCILGRYLCSMQSGALVVVLLFQFSAIAKLLHCSRLILILLTYIHHYLAIIFSVIKHQYLYEVKMDCD